MLLGSIWTILCSHRTKYISLSTRISLNLFRGRLKKCGDEQRHNASKLKVLPHPKNRTRRRDGKFLRPNNYSPVNFAD